MQNEATEGYDGGQRVKFVNFSRVLFYFTAAWIQLPLINEDAMIVLVPVILAIWDFIMGIWSNEPSTRFWYVSFIVPFISMIVASNTILHLMVALPLSSLGVILLLLSLGVFGISLVELNTLRKMTSYWNRNIKQTINAAETRTYTI